jgi:eukaryotic-like serine/threonine-protein kinase
MAFAPGSKLGPYEILAPLGAGGMGEVYRARDPRLGRTVAIKVLTSDLSADPILRERFEREARIVALLNHPHICTLFDVGREGGTVFLVMEYLEGETLEARLKSGPLPTMEVLRVGIEIADALEKAHREGVIHRDLKPANVMLTEAGVKLLDFGIATITQRQGDNKPSQESTTNDYSFTTSAGQVIGTASYMSPEQVRGLALDARTDLWSFGVLLYQMISGRMPFEGPTLTDLISVILLKEPNPLAVEHLEVPKWLADIVQRGLEKDREKRYQSAREILGELQRYKHKQEIEAELERMGQLPKVSAPAAPAPYKSPETSQAPAGSQTGGGLETIKSRQLALAVVLSLAAAAALGAISWIFSAIVLVAAGGAIAAYVYFSRTDSLAVMPFEWAGARAQPAAHPEREYLADGITESLIGALSHLDRLKVISRTSVFRYKGKELDLQQVRRELDVLKVLTGRIFPRGAALAVSVELVDVLDGKHVWGEKYECTMDDLAGLPRNIASEVSRSLRTRGARRGVRKKARAPSAGSYQSYLKGKYFWNKRKEADIRKAIECFQAAVSSDPGYALAYVGLAECYIVLGVYSSMPLRDAYAQAKRVVLKALEIDDSLAEAHAALAVVKAGDEWDLRGAFAEFDRAIRINPNYATAHQWYAELLVCAGRNAQAIAEAKRALELDPLSLVISETLAQVLAMAREYDRAIEQVWMAQEMDSLHYLGHRILRDAYVEKGMFEEAIAEHRLALQLAGESPDRVEFVGKALRKALSEAGPPGYWQKRIELATEDMQGPPRLPYDVTDVSPYHVAHIYAKLGYRDLAVKWIEKAYEERDYGIYHLKSRPAFDALQADPKVAAILRQIGLSD